MVWAGSDSPPREGAAVVVAGDGLEEGFGVEGLGGRHGALSRQALGGLDEEAGREPVDVSALAVHGPPPFGPDGLGEDLEAGPAADGPGWTLGPALDQRPPPR